MRHGITRYVAVMSVACLLGWFAGCRTTTHTSVRTYEYTDEPPVRAVDDELTNEYQMRSPGEMVGPGEMVEPGDADDDS